MSDFGAPSKAQPQRTGRDKNSKAHLTPKIYQLQPLPPVTGKNFKIRFVMQIRALVACSFLLIEVPELLCSIFSSNDPIGKRLSKHQWVKGK